MAALREFHEYWGWVAIAANALAGVVALLAWRVQGLRGRWVWGLTIGAEAAIMLQVLTGVILVSSGDYPNLERFHMFYGFVAFITVGLAYSYRYAMRGRLELMYGLVGLFLMGVGIRAVLQVVG
ncbi:MAG: hypothetical protein M5U31_09990 [Acidimicrobiia bacterium]|nr:hypothetical protein [Acidimicrobiia bacterium]